MPKTEKRRVLFTTDAKMTVFKNVPGAAASAAAPATASKTTLQGYAMKWNTLSEDRGGFRVRLLPGSAQFTDDAHALFHHDYRAVLGAKTNGTLRITPDDVGVKVEIDLPDTTTAGDVAELVDKGYVTGMSFSMLYDPMPTSCTKTEGGLEIMEVSSFTCDEVTITAIPAFTATLIEVQEEADDEESPNTPEPAYARIEQTLRLEQFRLQNLEL